MISKNILTVAVPQVAMQLIMFIRNILIARAVGPDDFGVCIALMATIAALDMFSDIGIEQYAVVAADGSERKVVSSLHLLSLGRGCLLAILLFILAEPVAVLIKMEEHTNLFRWLALYPLLRSASNVNIKVLQRTGSYKEEQLTFMCSQILATSVAIAGIMIAPGPSVMLWALVAQAIGYTIGSHAFAKANYEVGYHAKVLASAISFGLPLALFGAVNFVITQSDRMIVSSTYGPNDLGKYAAGSTIVLASSMLLQKISSLFFLPKVTGYSQDADIGKAQLLRLNMLGAVFTMAPLAAAGQLIVSFVFGDAFVLAWSFYVALAFLGAMRLLRSGYATLTLGTGSTGRLLTSGCISLMALGAAMLFASRGQSLTLFVWIIAAGEFVALLYLRNNRGYTALAGAR